MKKPKIEYQAGVYKVFFQEHDLYFYLDRIRENKDEDIITDIKIVHGPYRLYTGKINLSSARSRSELLKYLETSYGDILPWGACLEGMAIAVMDEIKKGSRIYPLDTSCSKDVLFLIFPLLIKNQINLFYGAGAMGKSFLGMFLSILVQNNLQFFGQEIDGGTVLYLDWETDSFEMSRRFTLLSRGLGDNLSPPLYRRCERSLRSELNQISNAISELSSPPKLLIIDSAWGACAGDIKSEETVLPFFSALRELMGENSTALVITHVTKEERRGKEKAFLPIGSIFFENIPRATWFVKKIENGNEMILTLYHVKHNMTPKFPPISLVFSFYSDQIEVSKALTEEEEKRSLSDEILEYLQDGSKTLSQIAEYLEKPKDVVNAILSRLIAQNKISRPQRGLYQLSNQNQQLYNT